MFVFVLFFYFQNIDKTHIFIRGFCSTLKDLFTYCKNEQKKYFSLKDKKRSHWLVAAFSPGTSLYETFIKATLRENKLYDILVCTFQQTRL